MRRLAPAVALLMVGCASSPETSGWPVAEPMDVQEVTPLIERFAEGTVSNIKPDVERVGFTVAASPEAVWPALVQVYENLGIEIAGMDPNARAVNNPDMRITRRLGGQRLSRYLDCGSGTIGGFADHFRIQMSILSQVEALPEGQSRVHTTIEAVGNNPEGTSNTRVPCSSTHQLELRIAEEIRELVGGGS